MTTVTKPMSPAAFRKLLDVPARVRFLSMEPLLGPVDLGAWIEPWNECGNCGASFDFEAGRPDECPGCGKKGCMCTGFGSVLRNDFDDADGRIEVPELPGIDWVIVGGESGSRARPMHPDWARSLRDQCEAAGVPFLFKQWGEWTPGENVERHRGTVATAKWWNDAWSYHEEDLASTDGHIDDAPDLYRVGKKAAGRLLDGRTWDGFPAP